MSTLTDLTIIKLCQYDKAPKKRLNSFSARLYLESRTFVARTIRVRDSRETRVHALILIYGPPDDDDDDFHIAYNNTRTCTRVALLSRVVAHFTF